MRDFFNMDGPFFTVINKIGDLVWLNILWLICCIPIVTIGASTTALYFEAMKLAEKNEGYVTRNFFKSFKQNFRQSTVIWLIMLFLGICIGFNVYLVLFVKLPVGNTVMTLLLSLVLLTVLVYVMIFVYIFPLQSKFVNKIKYTFKNSFILSLRHLPQTIILILTYAVSIFAFYKFSIMFPIFLLIGVALVAYGQSFILNSIFNIYINRNKTEEEKKKEENPDAWVIPEDDIQ